MASINNTVILQTIEYRPCEVNGKKALFHKWNTFCGVIEPSPMIGGAPGGQIQYTMGLVEFADGTIKEVGPASIHFLDNKIAEYRFPDSEAENESNG